jgi:hypothetical protein
LPVIAAAQQFLPAPQLPGGPVDPNTRFEVVSVRPAAPDGGSRMMFMPNGQFESAALQEQLGLKLEGARGAMEVVVIDKFEKPTPD